MARENDGGNWKTAGFNVRLKVCDFSPLCMLVTYLAKIFGKKRVTLMAEKVTLRAEKR